MNTIFDTIIRHTEHPPVDVYALAADLGIHVMERPMGDGCSGSIEKRNDIYIITVNSEHPPVRKRFTIAHEIGHFVYHGDLIEQQAIYDDKMYRDERIGGVNEAQANRFAAGILMPEKKIRSLSKDGVVDKEQLARIFDVSPQAMGIRLESLSLSV